MRGKAQCSVVNRNKRREPLIREKCLEKIALTRTSRKYSLVDWKCTVKLKTCIGSMLTRYNITELLLPGRSILIILSFAEYKHRHIIKHLQLNGRVSLNCLRSIYAFSRMHVGKYIFLSNLLFIPNNILIEEISRDTAQAIIDY